MLRQEGNLPPVYQIENSYSSNEGSGPHDEDEEDKKEEEKMSEHSSVEGSQTSAMAAFKNFNSFDSHATPRTLMFVIRLLFLLYFLMVSIGTVNMIINQEKLKESQSNIQSLRLSYERMNQLSTN